MQPHWDKVSKNVVETHLLLNDVYCDDDDDAYPDATADANDVPLSHTLYIFDGATENSRYMAWRTKQLKTG
jgi:hypothetical protein